MTDRAHGGNTSLTYDFSVNLNPFIPERTIKNIVSSYYKKAINYPEERAESLIKVVSKYYNLTEDNIVAGNGSIELLYNLPRVLKIDRLITLEPTFCEYRYLSEIYNLSHMPYHSVNEFYWDLKILKKNLKPKDLVIICNPNNPTGNIFLKEEILSLLREDIYLLVDEAFMDFSDKDESLIGNIRDNKNLMVLKSFTKVFSIAGLRIGFLLGDKDIIESLKNILPLWNVNGIAIEATKSFLDNKELIEKTKKLLVKEKVYLKNSLNSLPITILDSYANFFLIKTERARALINFAQGKGISLRSNAGFLGLEESFIRFAVKKRKENKILIQTFKEFFEG